MNLKDQLKELWQSVAWTGTAAFTLPSVIFEIQPGFLMVARLGGKTNGNGHAQFGRLTVLPLEPGTLAPVPAGPAVRNASSLASALENAAASMANGTNRVGVLVPDGIARVGVFPFETLPPNRREAVTLMGWKMRENLPFPPEEARITYQITRLAGSASEAPLEVIAVAARASVLGEFESLMEGINRSSVMILPATLALLPLLPAEGNGGQLLIHVYSDLATYVVVEGQRLRFWRTRDFGGLDPDDMFAQVAAEAARVVASTEDRLKLPLTRTSMCVRPPATEVWTTQLAEALGREVERLEPTAALGGLAGEDRSLFRQYGATLAGLAANQ